MAKLTQDAQREMTVPAKTYDVPVGVAGTVYDGALYCYQAGKAVDPSTADDLIFAGISMEHADGVAVNDVVRLANDVMVWLPLSAAALTDHGKAVYATDNGTITLSPTDRKRIGVVRGVRVGKALWVDLSKAEVA